MSNLEDIPLEEPQALPAAPSETSQPSKSNSLKRFFKVSKKPLMRDQADDESDASDEDNAKEDSKPKTLTRFFSRNKTAQKDVAEPSNSMENPITQREKPIPNVKPTIKASISSYWKLLFHRQKNRQDAGSGAQQSGLGATEEEELHELQPVQLQDSRSQSNTDLKEGNMEETSTDPKPKTPKETAEELQDSLEAGLTSTADPATETELPSPALAN
ncbi:uncharacterized protein [Drosophila bipectinata]|uniref:uncharacterized protein n=1 Tax=Drosophila bipectinata TaxID=42026 RepID=UPI001C8AD5DA|nr:uncharacterized protein LOC108129244 [Drosophila bipectinata]